MDGIINVYKEAGFTSHDVVAKLRGILHQKKIGHTGTLDPAAIGVLPVCCGKATKVCELLTAKDKTYQAVCRLGIVTDTQDTTGTILEEFSTKDITEKEVRLAVKSFEGEIMQIPPMYSARKVNGKKLYELAREGKEVERKPRPVTISKIDILQMDLESSTFTMEVTCSKGTYIRTLCHDIGQKLGMGAAMENLVRTRVDCFSIENAMTLEEIETLTVQNPEQFAKRVIPVDSLFEGYPKVQIKQEYSAKLANGNILQKEHLKFFDDNPEESAERYLVYDAMNHFKAIYGKHGKDFTVIKMF